VAGLDAAIHVFFGWSKEGRGCPRQARAWRRAAAKLSLRRGRAWPGHPRPFLDESKKDVDARDKRGHDG